MKSKSFSFQQMPAVSRRRTLFKDPFDKTTTMSVGKLYPIEWQEVVPGDDFNEAITSVTRLTSSYLRPVLDDIYLDTYVFFVPGRLLYDDYEGVFGNPKPSAYDDNDLGELPTIDSSSITVSSKSVADYLDLPLGSVPSGVSVLPFRAFALIWNEWFRNENTMPETLVQTGEWQPSVETINNDPWSETNYCGQLPPVAKIKDYFTSAVPKPQKGAPVLLPVAQATGDVPVITKPSIHGQPAPVAAMTMSSTVSNSPSGLLTLRPTAPGQSSVPVSGTALSGTPNSEFFYPNNLYASTSQLEFSGVAVDEFRLATQRQLMLVADTMYGSRYREYIYGHYGVTTADSRVQIPEYLCGKRVPLSVTQVAQTSQGTSDSALASLGGYSYTVSRNSCHYAKGFTEHGYVFCVACLRQHHTYQQGVAKKWTRKVRDDFYDPLFAHIGYQPIYTSEIYASGQSLKGNIFGSQEAWAEYKRTPSKISGEARSDAPNSLDVYHFADLYSSAPVIGAQFTTEVPTYVDRALAVPSTSQDQFIVQFHFESRKTRVMPVFCEPGYMDHWNR